MLSTVPVPYIVYWLVVKDFLYNLDFCDNNYNDTGYCMSSSQCQNILKGTVIGECGGASSSVCCRITLNYFNETYLLNPIFVMKSETEETRKMMLFSTESKCTQFQIQYGNKSIIQRKKQLVFYVPEVHTFKTPDRIMWPILASYSRESRDLKKQTSGQNYLYVVTLDKLDTDEEGNKHTPVSECISETDNDDKFYLSLGAEERFPIRKFFTPEMQKLNTMNLTVDMFDEMVEADKLSRRSLYPGMCKEEDSTCKKLNWEDIFTVGNPEVISKKFKTEGSFTKQVMHSDQNKHKEINVSNYVSTSKSILQDMMGFEDINEEPTNDEQNEEQIASNTLILNESFHDSNTDVEKDLKEKEIAEFQKVPLKGDSIFDEKGGHFKNYAGDVMRSEAESYDLRNPVHFETTHDMRKPVKFESTHNMRNPLEVETNHDLRKAVQIENTHDMRIPVKTNIDHDMRQPVTLHESHDLRWPVLEGENGLRSLDIENVHSEIESLNEYSKQGRRHRVDNIKNFNLTLDNISRCKVRGAFSNNLKLSEKKREQLNNLWKEASTVCGKAGSNNSTTNGRWPWMVSLHENISGKYLHTCSGALLNSLWVITVAHCVDMKQKSNLLLVLVLEKRNSEHDKENCPKIEIDEIIIHPRFSRGMFENDVALLRMKKPVKFQPTRSPICLPWSTGELKHGIPVFFAGWEQIHAHTSNDLQKLAVPIITNYECEILYSTGTYREKINDIFLCAGKDEINCNSESGSSLIALDSERRWSLIGMVSWGSMCNNLKQPGVYIRVSSYLQWIQDTIDCYEILI